MREKNFWNIGIDKLTLCYSIDENSILHQLSDENIDFGDFKLQRIESGHFKNSYHILSLWDNPNKEEGGLTWQIYGTLKFSRYTDKEDKATLAWVYYENKTLYQQLYPFINTVIFSEYQSQILGLSLRNITEMEIYIDTSRNAPKALKYAIRNNDISTILNGKVITNRKEKQNKIGYYQIGNLDRYTDLTIYIKQADNQAPSLKVYDKACEIKENGKEYISRWHQRVDKQALYRLEVSLRHEHLKTYFEKNRIELSYNLFSDREFLFNCFIHFANRLLRFRCNNKIYSILEMI